jgi:hypothetical protein
MKTFTKQLFVILILFYALHLNTVYAQSSDQMLIMWKNNVIPNKSIQYEEVVKKQVELLTKLGHPTPYFVYKTDNNLYYWVTYLNDFSSINDLNAKWWETQSALLSQFDYDFNVVYKDKVNYILPMIVNWRANLSYVPDGQVFDSNKPQYFRMGFCYGKIGYESALQDNWKDWVALFSKFDIDIGWNLYQGLFGIESPLYFWGETYDSPLDMEQKRSEAFGTMGEESNKLWQETQNLIRKIEYETGWYRPDLSYIPQQ